MLVATLLTLSLIAATPETPPGADPETPPETTQEEIVQKETGPEDSIQLDAEASEFARLCAEEVEGLHKFFHDWFVGELPNTDEAYGRFAEALAEDFVIISPSGTVTERDDLLARLRDSHGSGKEQGVKIWIRGFKIRYEMGDTAVVSYEEWQQSRASKRGRVSTAILKRDESAPGGVAWLHLHETWLPRSPTERMLGGE